MKRISTATKVVDKFGAGKPGFTNGNAVAGVAATDLESDWFDSVQEELANLVEAGGGVVDGSSNTQVLAALQALFVGAQQCRLGGTTATLTLSRVGRGVINIPSSGLAVVPAGGVALNAAGLTASTLYYIYAYMNGGNLALEASTTVRATDAATGLQIKTGDRSRLFVGIEWATGATAWGGLVRSWFNDPGFVATTLLPSTSSTASTTPIPINSAGNRAFLAFAGESAILNLSGAGSNTAANYSLYTWIGIDSTSAHASSSGAHSQNSYSGQSMSFSAVAGIAGLSEGYHFGCIIGAADGGGTGNWYGSANNGRTALRVAIPGGVR
ncbi:hypothetical protein [Herbaspirillum rubrisubalbicans]|uniref:hypothetical protein n=1 Tax=Herbaspirillum rubrisubalbicans TaxID=80842 RepID=UPI0015C530DB|nr:hypothetical protein [Herbaspirillum rubrisubalbicans]